MLNASLLFALLITTPCLHSADKLLIAKIVCFRMLNKYLIHCNHWCKQILVIGCTNIFRVPLLLIFHYVYCRTVLLKQENYFLKSSMHDIKWNHSFSRCNGGRAELCLCLQEFKHLGMLCNKLIKLSLTVLSSLFSV